MVGTGKNNDPVSGGNCAGDAKRHHNRLGTGIAESYPLHAGQAAEYFGSLASFRKLGGQLYTAPKPFLKRLDDKWRRMAKERHSEAHAKVDIAIAVDISKAGTGR